MGAASLVAETGDSASAAGELVKEYARMDPPATAEKRPAAARRGIEVEAGINVAALEDDEGQNEEGSVQ